MREDSKIASSVRRPARTSPPVPARSGRRSARKACGTLCRSDCSILRAGAALDHDIAGFQFHVLFIEHQRDLAFEHHRVIYCFGPVHQCIWLCLPSMHLHRPWPRTPRVIFLASCCGFPATPAAVRQCVSRCRPALDAACAGPASGPLCLADSTTGIAPVFQISLERWPGQVAWFSHWGQCRRK